MSDRELQPIEVYATPCTHEGLSTLRRVLNKFAAQGYAPLIGTYCPSKEGGMIVYVLGDVSNVGEQPEVDEPEAEEEEAPAADASPAQDPPSGTNGNGAHHPSEPQEAATEGGA